MFLETVGNRVLEGQRAAFAHGGVPRVGPASRAGWLEERLVKPRLNWILGRAVAMCVSRADECGGAPGVAVDHRDRGQATEPFEPHERHDRFAAKREFLAERLTFELDRQAIDDVERGANDSDWQPAKDAARQIAFAEDRAIFEGYTDAGIVGIRQGTSNPKMPLPADVRQYPNAIAQALSQLRLVGVNGPYAVLLGADAYTALAETSDQGYPVLEHVKRLVDDKIIWAPAIDGAFVVTTRGGDFELHIGQDVSIGYLSHNEDAVRLYLQETFTFLLLTSEAAVALTPSANSEKP